MQYVEAFNALGYEVPSPRQDWSAEKTDGICITLWKVEIDWTPPPPRIDLWKSWVPGQNDWDNLPGHRKRTQHIGRAMSDFEGWIDVIIVKGTPRHGYGSAEVWNPAQRMNHRWRISRFDQATGFFSAATEKIL